VKLNAVEICTWADVFNILFKLLEYVVARDEEYCSCRTFMVHVIDVG